MKKTIFVLNYLLFLNSCNGQNSTNTVKRTDTWSLQDTFPVSLADMRQVQPPFFKIFRGSVEGHPMTLILKKSSEHITDVFRGSYYFDNESIAYQTGGNEGAVFEHYSSTISSIESEMENKSNPQLQSCAIYIDSIGGWVRGKQFIGYRYDIATGKDIDKKAFSLDEVSPQYDYWYDHMVISYKKGTFDVYGTLVLPLDSIFRKKLLEEFFGISHFDKVVWEGRFKKWVQDSLVKVESMGRTVRRMGTYDYNEVLYPSLMPLYLDSHLISVAFECAESRYSLLRTYELSTQRFLTENEVFKTNTETAVRNIVLKTPTIQSVIEEGTFDTTQKMNFFLTKSGVMFQFMPTNTVFHFIYTFVPYSQLKPYLTDEFKHKVENWR